jgi:hypothetical protein
MGLLFNIFQVPILILNFFGFFVSGIWLLVIGQWRMVVAGFLSIVVANFAIGIALLPGAILAGPAVYMAKKRITIGLYFFGFLSAIYTYTVITAWCGAVTFTLLRDAPSGALWPLLIWAYGITTAPWTLMARREGSITALLAGLMVQVAYIVMMGAIALFGVDLVGGMNAFTGVIAIGVILHMRMLVDMRRAGMLEMDPA